MFPQQKLDDIEGLEDTPDKSKKKKNRRLLKPYVSSDSDDAYPGTPVAQMSDSSASSMNVNRDEGPSMLPNAKIKAKDKYREQSSVRDKKIRLCGLCNTHHGKGVCDMTEDSVNLVEYRAMLINHTSDEPWPVRVWT